MTIDVLAINIPEVHAEVSAVPDGGTLRLLGTGGQRHLMPGMAQVDGDQLGDRRFERRTLGRREAPSHR